MRTRAIACKLVTSHSSSSPPTRQQQSRFSNKQTSRDSSTRQAANCGFASQRSRETPIHHCSKVPRGLNEHRQNKQSAFVHLFVFDATKSNVRTEPTIASTARDSFYPSGTFDTRVHPLLRLMGSDRETSDRSLTPMLGLTREKNDQNGEKKRSKNGNASH